MLSKLRTPGLLLFATSLLSAAQALPSAATVLDRYIQVTGGRAAWVSKRSVTTDMEGRDLDTGRVVLKATIATSRQGDSLTSLSVPEQASEGVYKGTAWALTTLSGARIKRDLDRDEALRSARMLEEGNWREFYGRSRVEAVEDIEGRRCYRVAMMPSADHRTEWFDVETGLLVKWSTAGPAASLTYVVEDWAERDELRQPSTFLAERDGFRYRVKILRVAYNSGEKFGLPAEVERRLAEERSGKALPNAEELIERHIFESGGQSAYQNLRTQHVTGTLEFVSRNMEASTETISAGGGRFYQAVDLPGFGKNEQGSDGRVAWERSPVLGPRARARRDLSGLSLTLDAAQVIGWRYLLRSVQTEARETIDGRDCYRVRLTLRDGSEGGLRWYDRKTGLLYRSSAPMKTEMGTVPTVTTYLTYKPISGLQWPVLIRMDMAGQELVFTARNVELNRPIADSAFGLPEDIQTLSK